MPDLTICVMHSGRSVIQAGERRIELFPRCLDSLNLSVAGSGVDAELVVADWPEHSGDNPVRDWLPNAVRFPHAVFDMSGQFSKGRGCNAAADVAESNVLFFCDCDMLVPDSVLVKGMAWTAAGKAYFPGYLAQDSHGVLLKPRSPGAGNAFMTKAMFRDSGGWPENKTWGKFDRPVWNWFDKHGLAAEPLYEREIVPGFVHLWHPKFAGWEKL